MDRREERFREAMEDYFHGLPNPPRTNKEFVDMINNFKEEYFAKLPPLSEKTAQTADDFLTLSQRTNNRRKKIQFAKKAAELAPHDIGAVMEYYSLTADEKELDKYFNLVEKLYQESTARYEAEGLLKKYKGRLFDKISTRMYMMLSLQYTKLLANGGKIQEASEVAERMLELNDFIDIPCVRYELMHYYAYFKNEDSAMKLYEKFHRDKGAQLLLPIVVLYYNLGEDEKALKWLKKISTHNRDAKKFFNMYGTPKFKQYERDLEFEMPREGTIDEFVKALIENRFLYEENFMNWARDNLNEILKKSSAKNFFIK